MYRKPFKTFKNRQKFVKKPSKPVNNSQNYVKNMNTVKKCMQRKHSKMFKTP